MKIMNISHVALNVRNMKPVLDFYCDGLGMKKQFTLYYGDLLEYALKQAGEKELSEKEKKKIEMMKLIKDRPWLVYLKLQDRQFIELFYSYEEKEEITSRDGYYGYQKVGYEVKNIEDYYRKLLDKGIVMEQPLAQSADYSMEFVVKDPEGNRIHFIEYPNEDESTETIVQDPISDLLRTTQVAYQINNAEQMKQYYLDGLGLKIAKSMTFNDCADYLRKKHAEDLTSRMPLILQLEKMGNLPWIDFVEVAKNQYIEFFYCYGEGKKTIEKTDKTYGYSHLCLEVKGIQNAYDELVKKGIRPETQISLGPDGSYQFWLKDPDGNRMELMEYGEQAKQLKEEGVNE